MSAKLFFFFFSALVAFSTMLKKSASCMFGVMRLDKLQEQLPKCPIKVAPLLCLALHRLILFKMQREANVLPRLLSK